MKFKQDETKKADLPGGNDANVGCVSKGGAEFDCEEIDQLTDDIVMALKSVHDPEIPVDIYELGLIYKVDFNEQTRDVEIEMTLTAPGCPVAGEMPIWVQNAVASVVGVRDVQVELTFDPPWNPDMMSDEARIALNWF